MIRRKPLVAVVLVLAGLQLAACGGGSETAGEIEAATLEPVDGTDISRVILAAEAAERLGITTSPVRSEEVARKRQFGAEVVRRPTGAAPGPALWVRVALTQAELATVDLGAPALVLPLLDDSADDDRSGFLAGPAGSDVNDPGDTSGGLYYTVAGRSRLTPGTPVLIELSLANTKRLIVPYGSVVYDPQGRTWAYTSPEPLVFVRHPISIEYIDGDEAFLLDGPSPGTEVVSVGAAELSGFEGGIGN